MKVGIINYGVGNLGSVVRALEELGVAPLLISSSTDLGEADKLILPGVGNFSNCARILTDGGWLEEIDKEVRQHGKPLLGVCVGMQLLASYSMEGPEESECRTIAGTPGLGFIPGRVEHLRTLGCNLRVPHVGWNEVTGPAAGGGLFDGIADGTDFYFVHSYAFVPDDPADILARTHYGIPVTAAVRRGHVWGTQFHPEKSSRAGFRLLRNFIHEPVC